MTDKPENPPVFPFQHVWESGDLMEPSTGMSLRDWFAGMALSGWSSNMTVTTKDGAKVQTVISEAAYKVADAMLAERAKRDAP